MGGFYTISYIISVLIFDNFKLFGKPLTKKANFGISSKLKKPTLSAYKKRNVDNFF